MEDGAASVGAIVTNLRLRMTKKGEKMAWLTLADATGAIEAAVTVLAVKHNIAPPTINYEDQDPSQVELHLSDAIQDKMTRDADG